MKKLMYLGWVILGVLQSACSEGAKRHNSEKTSVANTEAKANAKSKKSADYSALLTNFNCDINAEEIAKVIGVAISDIKRTSSQEQAKKIFGSDFPFGNKEESKAKDNTDCMFELMGFGKDKLGNALLIEFRTSDLGKATIKDAIEEHLEHREEGIEKMTQRFIVEADTKDNYITTQPRYGRVNIYNENYDGAFIISYGSSNSNNNRTQEQQDVLGQKMVKLANHLLKKYKK